MSKYNIMTQATPNYLPLIKATLNADRSY